MKFCAQIKDKFYAPKNEVLYFFAGRLQASSSRNLSREACINQSYNLLELSSDFEIDRSRNSRTANSFLAPKSRARPRDERKDGSRQRMRGILKSRLLHVEHSKRCFWALVVASFEHEETLHARAEGEMHRFR